MLSGFVRSRDERALFYDGGCTSKEAGRQAALVFIKVTGAQFISQLKKFANFRPVLRIRSRDPVVFYPKDPGSGMTFFGSRIPNMTKIKF
jgi:hypothetical protein